MRLYNCGTFTILEPFAMSEILGKERSVKSLLGQQYWIDYYQRDYKWERKHIRELVDDLTDRFLQYYEEGHERRKVAEYGQYFLGSVIISEKDNKKFIVDGQQRLTSLTLLLIYLNRLQETYASDDQVYVMDLIRPTEYGQKSFNLNVNEPERNTCLQKLMDGMSPDPTDEPLSIQNLINRFSDIADIFPVELRDKKVLPYFLDWLTKHVMLVEIKASSDDEAYTIFETMNDRGLSLSPTDMLKGYLLAKIEDDTSRTHAEREWKKQVNMLRDLAKDEDIDCIKAWLRSQYASNIRKRKARAKPEDFDKLGTEFHRWVRKNHHQIGLNDSDSFASFITDKFKFYARAYIKARKAADGYTSRRLSSIFFNSQNNFTLQYPLMLAPLLLTDNEETMLRKMTLVATFIEITLARRIWNYKPIGHSTMLDRVFRVMKDIRELKLEDLRANLALRLSPKGAGQDGYFDFQTEKTFGLHKHGNNRRQVHRLLARLTEFLEVEAGQKERRYEDFASLPSRKGGYQIEHIWADHPEQYKDEFSTPEDFPAYRNRIGGLVLLPAADNASYSDKIYEEKHRHYIKQNLLASSLHPTAYENNPRFRKFREANPQLVFKPKETFRKADLDERQELYIALADLCWSPNRLNDI